MKTDFFRRSNSAIFLVLACSLFIFQKLNAFSGEGKPLIFPAPQEITVGTGHLSLNEETVILIPRNASENDLLLARFLVSELTDKFGLALRTERVSKLPVNGQFILMGSVDNPLVKEYCSLKKLTVTSKNPGSEGYILQVTAGNALVAGSDRQGAFYGLQSLRQLIRSDKGITMPCVYVRDWPDMPFRGIKLYIPGRENMTFFKRFVRDFMALYKFNKVIIEVNAVMRFDRHPELNAGWIEFARELDLSRRNNALGPGGYYQNSNHRDAGDGWILEKQEVRDMVEFCNQNFLEVIPEIPTLSHAYYLLTRHRELADIQNSEWPSAYCPSNPETYDLLFDVFDEYIEVMKPKMIHVGRDEWWGAARDSCPRCRGKDYAGLFAEDLLKIHGYLAKKDIKTAMWGDHLLESVRKKGYIDRKFFNGNRYQTPGALPPEMVKAKVPKDILIFNWFFEDPAKDIELQQFGFQQVYGNFLPGISGWDKRKELPGVLGGAPSSWTATTEYNFGKDLMDFFLGCSNLLWSAKTSPEPAEHFRDVQRLMPQVRMDMDGRVLPGETGDPVVPLKIDTYFNTSGADILTGTNLGNMKSGQVRSGKMVFELADKSPSGLKVITVGTEGTGRSPLTREVTGIRINEDLSSVIFLHACASKANNEKAYRKIYNFDDSADLLGWYEVVYEDDFIISVPIRYGYNILEWDVLKGDNYKGWYKGGQGSSQDRYCYRADLVDCSVEGGDTPVTFFAFEWMNPRLGKNIREINLRGSSDFVNAQDRIIRQNAVMLAAISVVKKRVVKDFPDIR